VGIRDRNVTGVQTCALPIFRIFYTLCVFIIFVFVIFILNFIIFRICRGFSIIIFSICFFILFLLTRLKELFNIINKYDLFGFYIALYSLLFFTFNIMLFILNI